MKNLTIALTAMFLLTFVSTGIFAANGNKGDWGFEPKSYKYALIEGEIISIDHDKKALHVKGTEEQVFSVSIQNFSEGLPLYQWGRCSIL